MKHLRSTILATALFCAPFQTMTVWAQDSITAEESEADFNWDNLSEEERAAAISIWVKDFHNALSPRTGEISLINNSAILNVPDSFYFLNKTDSARVLEEGWGNPPDASVLGMLFPTNMMPLDDDAWGVVVFYEDIGYVSDEDAGKINYDDLLADLQAQTRSANLAREEMGYESIELVGWAAAPEYRADTHRMFWAKELRFGGIDTNTLNYDMRILGRKGVLTLQFVSGIDQLSDIQLVREDVLAIPDFTVGNRYEDFDPATDKVSGVTLAGLVAGGAGVALAKKTGFLAVALVFLKKAGVFIIAGIAMLWRLLAGRKKDDVPPSS